MSIDRKVGMVDFRAILAATGAFLAGFLSMMLFPRNGNLPVVKRIHLDIPSAEHLLQSVQMVEADDSNLPAEGEATLLCLFGWREALALQSALGGRYATTDKLCRFARDDRITRIWLPALAGSDGDAARTTDDAVPVWTLDIDNRSGAVVQRHELPDLSNQELAGIVRSAHRANPAVALLMKDLAPIRARLDGRKTLRNTACYDVQGLRVGDRMKFHWFGVFDEKPSENDRDILRFVYWVDIASRKVVDKAVEVQGKNVAIP